MLAPNRAHRPPERPQPPEVRADGVCPYKGLDAYDVGDAKYFFGREALTARLLTRLAEQPAARGLITNGQ